MYQVVKTVDRILRGGFQDAIAVFSATPVISSAEFAMVETSVVRVNTKGIKHAAISQKIAAERYSPRTWRTQPLHICPPEPYSHSDPLTRQCLNWIFIISALNFSFWSEKDSTPERYGVEWRKGYGVEERVVHTGYWSLVAAVNRALEESIPITEPAFYSSESLCPDSLIAYVFRAAAQCSEPIPLLQERIAIMREVGSILCNDFNGSYLGLLESFHNQNSGQGTALDLAQMVTNTFPSFRDEQWFNGRKVLFWKRAQILVAETWAAFYPENSASSHPIFPNGPAISTLTMFAGLSHSLVHKLQAGTYLTAGCREEISLRAASIVAVERLRNEITRLPGRGNAINPGQHNEEVSSVLIDFYLWDLAKKIERGEEQIEEMATADMVPVHRTRSIWY
ncbi:hypothetical protein EDD15DRAFT_2391668 [Pisolithus albus]|nr:hypothetical protein EDD15DRAFT_2391668 [Pisolithus albus]